LKTVSSIPINTSENEHPDLLIEVSDLGVSFLWFNKSPFLVKGVSVHVFDENDQNNEALTKILSSIKSSVPNIGHVHLLYDYRDSVIIPEAYNLENDNKDIIELMYGSKEKFSTRTEKTVLPDLYNTYRFAADLNNLLSGHFTVTTQSHSNSLLIKNESDDISLYCIVFYDAIKIILHRGGKLLNIQQYTYSKPDDVLYHLLNTCRQYDIIPADITLTLSGMIIKDSHLYNHLHNHFQQVRFMEIEKEISGNDEISNLPLHFFTHLTDLARCV
jgi:hypothetical protein